MIEVDAINDLPHACVEYDHERLGSRTVARDSCPLWLARFVPRPEDVDYQAFLC
jgi:hypothetical protein